MDVHKSLNTSILLLATLDTKGAEALYLAETLRALGGEPVLMDLSMRRADCEEVIDFPAEEVARAGGVTLDAVNDCRDMSANMDAIVKGASLIASRLMAEGRMGGIIGIGGYTGSFMATSVMRVLPFGFPKVMVSSAAGMRGVSHLFLNTSDIMLFHSVVDISGLSGPVRNVLERGACALWAMLCGPVTGPILDREKALAITMMSPCEQSARSIRRGLEGEGYQVIGYHANGVGDRAMEEMVGAGLFRGVIDLAPGGVGEHLFGFMRDAGPSRLEAAARMGLPQIVSTCGVNHITPSRSAWSLFPGRRRCDLDRFRTWLRATPAELREIARLFAHKLNRSTGPVKIMVPLQGWSAVDRPGCPTYDPEEDRLFCLALKTTLREDIEIIEVDANMEDPEFASAVLTHARLLFL